MVYQDFSYFVMIRTRYIISLIIHPENDYNNMVMVVMCIGRAEVNLLRYSKHARNATSKVVFNLGQSLDDNNQR